MRAACQVVAARCMLACMRVMHQRLQAWEPSSRAQLASVPMAMLYRARRVYVVRMKHCCHAVAMLCRL